MFRFQASIEHSQLTNLFLATQCPLGIDVFLFVVKFGRWKPEHEAALDAFAANCGEEALARTLIVWTCCPLSRKDLKLQVQKSAPASLRRMLPKLAGYPIGIEQIHKDLNAARSTLLQGLAGVLDTHIGRYTNDVLHEARKRYRLRDEEERKNFAAAIADLRKRTGPIVIEREYLNLQG